ncbi:MAG: EFR1 family ferrodoxin [Deltaproteobacteria bacterium]|nr:EFR1 family ferrodoxin [Deltaproteobacteria bacterium]
MIENHKNFIFYCSPAGTTRHAAGVIADRLRAADSEVTLCEVGKNEKQLSQVLQEVAEADAKVCLYLGSPVYSSHALPLMMALIERLPVKSRAYAVPFATWGGATSGLALEEMGAALTAKGYGVLAAAKVLAVHSLMWQLDNPVGFGHPDAADDRLLEALVEAVEKNLSLPEPLLLHSAALEYQPRVMAEDMRKLNLRIAGKILPQREINQDKCTQCGQCAEQCPVAALTLNPWPSFAENCILCFNCMRLCPEEAIAADLSAIYARIRERAQAAREGEPSQIYLP